MNLLQEATYNHAKVSCYRCGQPSGVVDFDMLIEGEGILCLCRGCVAEAALLIGWVTAEDADRLKLQVAELGQRCEDMAATFEAAQDILAAIAVAKDKVTAAQERAVKVRARAREEVA